MSQWCTVQRLYFAGLNFGKFRKFGGVCKIILVKIWTVWSWHTKQHTLAKLFQWKFINQLFMKFYTRKILHLRNISTIQQLCMCVFLYLPMVGIDCVCQYEYILGIHDHTSRTWLSRDGTKQTGHPFKISYSVKRMPQLANIFPSKFLNLPRFLPPRLSPTTVLGCTV